MSEISLSQRLRILNLGCGTSPLPSTKDAEYVNVDAILLPEKEGIKFIQADITQLGIIEGGNFDTVYLFHCIEHIPEPLHARLLTKIRANLKLGGTFVISYPEFVKCAQNYIDNKFGKREFWKATIYGRGTTEWDRHKALMDTRYFVDELSKYGFQVVKELPEAGQDFNTLLVCKAIDIPLSYEDLMKAECRNTIQASP